jgi:iron complex transport system ATP-binding protein
MLEARNISFRVDGRKLLEETSLSFEPGLFHVIMGANGAGKSTLLKMLAADQKPATGKILLNDRELKDHSMKELARKRAVLSQHYHISFPITVKEIVLMGRYPYFSGNPSKEDLSIVKQAMELMDVTALAERDYNTLSGGEAQKAQMARVLSQIWQKKESILFLDEPVSHLDIRFQHQLLKAAKNLCIAKATVIAILHDINLAMAFADRIIFIKEGRIVYDKRDLNDITPGIISDVFDVSSHIIYPEGHKPVIIF